MTLEEILRGGFEELGLPLDAEAAARCRRYYELLTEKNRVMNLTAIEGEEDSARLHFLDCAALLTLCDFGGRRVIDVGSGAGFPGLVLKIARPDIDLTLLDSLDKRVKFLRETADALGFTDVTCVHARAEEAPADYRERFDIAVSRAVARLNLLCELCLPFVKTGGLFVAMKGPGAAEELDEAKKAIRTLGGELERAAAYTIPGTEVRHTAILIRKVADTPARYPRRWAQMKKQPL
ncbi:MAG: 16S rRNA (guanine(527)-N(7))-methyltransferase RsmG [Oscillospiraceae bacterium]|nr:16S rRNA (guanine(527)-N(7))-methyltransferase RsmG [Oscillospiraceae bacterium]